MSRAGALASEGYHYQTLIATHWLIRLLREPEKISAIQVESLGFPGEQGHISVDDIVVRYTDDHLRFIQAKKNQTDYKSWSISELKDELIKARDQIENTPKEIAERIIA